VLGALNAIQFSRFASTVMPLEGFVSMMISFPYDNDRVYFNKLSFAERL